MPRFFIELSYKGTQFSGFQVQENARTVQSAVEEAFALIHRQKVAMTGSSRTDAGVHSKSNFFHFDAAALHPQFLYKMNALLSPDIALKNCWEMPAERHCRFDAIGRRYRYRVHRNKDPFAEGFSYYYPYRLNLELMAEAAAIVKERENFQGFSKSNTQVKHFICKIERSEWNREGEALIYTIEANRFLRGMVRLLAGALLRVGREQLSVEAFKNQFENDKNPGFSVPAHGLYLEEVSYPENYFP
ncbi:MAG: tRNA pseudouridine(38-40) synthase TruA [Flavisolibacter sp.]|nr:tRNA pseudouridine(38-40) synthase TruA [Flavisolibacter sp.]